MASDDYRNQLAAIPESVRREAMYGTWEHERVVRLDVHEPEGQRFWDRDLKQDMLLVGPGQPFAGWVCYRHPDGQWVTLRKEPTLDDWKAIDAAAALGYKGRSSS